MDILTLLTKTKKKMTLQNQFRAACGCLRLLRTLIPKGNKVCLYGRYGFCKNQMDETFTYFRKNQVKGVKVVSWRGMTRRWLVLS